LNGALAQSSTQTQIRTAIANLASQPALSPQVADGLFDGLGVLVTGASGLSVGNTNFTVYPNSFYIDTAGDICYAGFIPDFSGQSPNQFGPAGDPCASLRARALSDEAAHAAASVIAADIAAAQVCDQPVCNATSSASPLPAQFCAQGWDQPPSPTCTATWSCYSPQQGDASQVAISCTMAWASNNIGQFGVRLYRGTSLIYSAPLDVSINYIDPLPSSTTYPADVSYQVKIVPNQLDAPTDNPPTPSTTFSTDALNACGGCEPLTCSALSEAYPGLTVCGALATGCGGTVTCGSCNAGVACIENFCGGPPKAPPVICHGTTCM
jgi:hypothetical protein